MPDRRIRRWVRQMRVLEMFFLPPMAVARVGAGKPPLESFSWVDRPCPSGPSVTQIEPAITLEVRDDGGVRPYLPGSIRFKDEQGHLKPVAPFFELWARVQLPDGSEA